MNMIMSAMLLVYTPNKVESFSSLRRVQRCFSTALEQYKRAIKSR